MLFVHAAAEMGIGSSIALLTFFILPLTQRRSPYQKAFVVSMLVHNLFDASFYSVGVAGMFVAFLAATEPAGKESSPTVSRFVLVVLGMFCAYVIFKMPLA